MACLDMYNQNPDHKAPHCGAGAPPPMAMSPRISFSNDFAESNHSHHHHHHHHHMIKTKPRSEEGPVSSDFEFSAVSNNSMMSADELFSKGRLLPFKDSCTNQFQRTTLREELLVDDDDDDDDVSMTRPPNPKGSSTRWKELLGLRKNHNGGSKKYAKNDGFVGTRPCLAHEEAHVSKSSQEMVNDGGSSCRDVEFGM